MKRLFRRVFIALVLLIVGLAIAGVIIRARMLARPSWYARPVLDAETRAALANSLDQKLIGAWTAAAEAQAAEMRARHANPDTPTIASAEPIVLIATEDEINSSFNKWKATAGWNRGSGKYLQDPVVALDDHTIILAATVSVKGLDAVVSLHFAPRLEGEKLIVGLSRVVVGTLPLPKSYFRRQIRKMTHAMEEKLPEWRKTADIGPHGWANADAMQAAMTELLVNALEDKPAEPALFVPEPHGGKDIRYLPVRIIGIDISNKTLTLTVQPMNPDQREALLEHIRAPQ